MNVTSFKCGKGYSGTSKQRKRHSKEAAYDFSRLYFTAVVGCIPTEILHRESDLESDVLKKSWIRKARQQSSTERIWNAHLAHLSGLFDYECNKSATLSRTRCQALHCVSPDASLNQCKNRFAHPKDISASNCWLGNLATL